MDELVVAFGLTAAALIAAPAAARADILYDVSISGLGTGDNVTATLDIGNPVLPSTGKDIRDQAIGNLDSLEIIVVDDGSSETFDPCDVALPVNGLLRAVHVVRLALNLGHQRAIAAGMVTLANREDLDYVIIMDCDGEDRPSDIPVLLQTSRSAHGHLILAHRHERSESMAFKAGYVLYKRLFRLLTGQSISFGNYSLLPMHAVRRLVRMPELWNNLPAAIIRSRLRFSIVKTSRGKRYSGESKMNFPGLVAHGLSAMSVYTDIIFVRVLLAATAISVVSIVSMFIVVMIRLTTQLAIPGWTTTVYGDLLIILIQAVMLIVATSLMVLANRSHKPLIPLTDAPVFIAETVTNEAGAPMSDRRGTR